MIDLTECHDADDKNAIAAAITADDDKERDEQVVQGERGRPPARPERM